MHSWYLYILISVISYFVLMWFKNIRLSISEVLFSVQSLLFIGFFHQLDFYLILPAFEYLVYFYLFVVKRGNFKENILVLSTTPVVFYSSVHLIDSVFVLSHDVYTSFILLFLLVIRFYLVLNIRENKDLLLSPLTFSLTSLMLSRFYGYDNLTSHLSWVLISIVIFLLIYEHYVEHEKCNLYFFIAILWAISLLSNSMISIFYFLPTYITYLFITSHTHEALSKKEYPFYLFMLFFIISSFWNNLQSMITLTSGGSLQILWVWPIVILWILKKLMLASDKFNNLDSDKATDWWIVAVSIGYLVVSVGGRYGS